MSMHGEAAFDAMALDLDVQAPDLSAVGKALGTFRKTPSIPLAGSAQISAHLTGSPKRPQANLHLRAPRFRQDARFAGTNIAIDGNLGGNLKAPDGKLLVTATDLQLGQIALKAPRIDMQLAWPMAHLRVASGVSEGDRKSTRLNSSHVSISYAVFCLKKKKKTTLTHTATSLD